MKRTKDVKKLGKVTRRKTVALSAAAEEPSRSSLRPSISVADVQRWYKPIKKAVTLRLDADVLEWFKKPGRGYQTRINRALRKVMNEETKSSKE